jgi:uncharacterized protein (DUF1499 family)
MAGKLAVVSVLLFGAGPVVAHFGVASPLVGFGLFALGGLLGLVALIWGGIAAARGRAPWSAAVLGLIVTAIFVTVALPGRSFPPYNDFTTDLVDPPAFVKATEHAPNQGRDMGHPGGEVAEAQRQAYADLAPLDLPLAPADAFARVVEAARAMPAWEITAADPQAGLVEGTATTRLFRFQDDFVIRVRPRDGGSRIDMRSKSRDGRGDLGANAARIRAFFAKLQPAG